MNRLKKYSRIGRAVCTALLLTTLTAAVTASQPYRFERVQFERFEIPLSDEIQEFAFYLCCTYEIEFKLIAAVMSVESGYTVNAISRGGDYGLMQINKINHKWLTDALGVTDYLDPYQNIRAGVYILQDLIDKYGVERALMAYNLGEGGAAALCRRGIYRTGYVDKIMTEYEKIK